MSIPTTTDAAPDHAPNNAAPVSPTTSNTSTQPAQQPAKRSSRRANTAERRATHNAVERARRETLNGRFLDLAAMLPNLAAVRRPSKSAIVNSSIALIHAQRRQRVVAAREVRLLKAENDALRQELNEWRQRTNLPRVEEPPRSTDLIALLNLEDHFDQIEEQRPYDMHDGSYEDADDYAEDGDDDLVHDGHYASYGQPANAMAAPAAPQGLPMAHPAHLAAQQQAAAVYHQKVMARASQQQQQMAQKGMLRIQPHQQAQVVTPTQQLPYGNEQGMYVSDMNSAYPLSAVDEKVGYNMFGNNVQVQQAMSNQWPQKVMTGPNPLVTPPNSAQGIKTSPYASTANQAFLTNYPQQNNGLGMFQPSFLGGPGSVGSEDDTSSVGSSGQDGSHFSAGGSPEHMGMGASPIDQFGFNNGFVQQPQQRRPSVNIPAQAYLAAAPKQASPIQNGGQQFAAMGLMM